MPRSESDKIIRRHVLVFEDDWTFLVERFGDKGLNVGVSKIIREVIKSYVKGLRGRIDEASAASGGELELAIGGSTPEQPG